MSNRSTPIVPHVLYVAEQRHPWRLAPYERLVTRYHTPTTVATEFGTVDLTVQIVKGKTGVSKQQTHVYCLADDAAWSQVQLARGALQAHLDALAAGLRDLGGYAKRLEEAHGFNNARNPLSATVIFAPDPDLTKDGYFITNPVPHLRREQITSHTPKMLRVERDGRPWSVSHQRDHFVCPDDAAWERIQALVAAVQRAADAWQKLLRELGTYHSALADGRYARRQEEPSVAKQARTAPAPAAKPTQAAPPSKAADTPEGGWGYHTLPITQIRRDGGTQARVGLNEDTVQEYAEAMREERWNWSAPHRPIVCWDADGYWLADGFHRIEAGQRAGLTEYPVEVLRDGRRAALLRAAGANAEHGLRRTNADKRRAVELLLRDEEWRGWSDREIGRRCAVDHKTVGVIRTELYPGNSPDSRTVERGGTTYEMTSAPERRCRRCNKPSNKLTSYGPDIIFEYPNGIAALCHPCIVELIQAQRAREQAEREAPAPIEQLAASMAGALEEEFGIPVEVVEGIGASADGSLAARDPHFTLLCEQAEQCGAQINYLALKDPRRVRVTPPPSYQQQPLDCDAADLARYIATWAPAPAPTWAIGPSRTQAAKIIKAHISMLPEPIARLLLLALAEAADERRGVLTYHRPLLDSSVTGALVGIGERRDRDAALLKLLLEPLDVAA